MWKQMLFTLMNAIKTLLKRKSLSLKETWIEKYKLKFRNIPVNHHMIYSRKMSYTFKLYLYFSNKYH